MEFLRLPSSGLRVSRMGFGSAAISGFDYGKVDDAESIGAIQAAWGAGVNLFDTSNVYGFGHAEEVLAKALGSNRHEAVIATKFGVAWDESGRTFRDSRVRAMTKALEESLRRLKLDCIPIYMIHWHDLATPLPELMDALRKCQQQGKIRHIGCSNFSTSMVREASTTAKMDFVQLPYSLVRTEHEHQLTESNGMGITTMAYDVLARGLLSGKYDRTIQFGANDTRSKDRYFAGAFLESSLVMVDRLRAVAGRHGKTPAQVSIRWALEQPSVNCVLIGSKRPAQVAENIDVFEWCLTPEDGADLRPVTTG